MTIVTRIEIPKYVCTNMYVSGNRTRCIAPDKHLLTFLWFGGHQTASYRDVADRFDVSLSSLHNIITRVAVWLSDMSQEVIQWPTPEAQVETKRYYRRLSGFPNVIGKL